MIRRILYGVAGVVLAGVSYAGIGLFLAHRAIDAIDPPIPAPEVALRFDPASDLPVGLTWINTASQEMPRSSVIEPDLDPDPDASYVMSHAAFALQWSNGRIFLIDAGMDEASAHGFGATVARFSAAEPIEFHGTVAARLGDSVARVSGIGFTHLHTDHTDGIEALCDAHPGDVRVMQTRMQVENLNYTTRGGDEQIATARCASRRVLEANGPVEVPGFAGLFVLPVGGHTPGSQVFIAHVRGGAGTRTYLFVGDLVNHGDALIHDLPKPAIYSRFAVPESTERLARLRPFIQDLVARHGVTALVSHDQAQISSTGVPERRHSGAGRARLGYAGDG